MAITISGTDGIVGAGFTVDNSGVSVTAGVGTFGSIGAGTSIAAAGLHGTMPTINGHALTTINAANIVGVCTSGLTKTGGFGAVLQVVSTTKTDTTSATSQDSWDDISGLSVSITPASTSNKILVTAHLKVSWTNGGYCAFRLERGGSAIAVGDADGNRTQGFHGTYKVSDASYYIYPVSVEFLDSPSSTSALTYNVAWFNPTSEASVRYLNRTVDDANGDYRFRTISTITATEISA